MCPSNLNIYDLFFNDVLITERIEEFHETYREDYHLRAIAESRGQAHTLGIRFIEDLFGWDEVTIGYLDPVSIRKIGPAWNGAQPECDWPVMFEHGCIEEWEAELAS